MNLLPTPEERQWLIDALKKLVSRRGDLLDAAPLVEPSNAWFPEPWSMTAAHGHRLAQRLMYYAGLRDLRISLDAYEHLWAEDEEEPWDANTAGWFAGIVDGRAIFGLRVNQFHDPENAAGVLAHEVAHAWRAHHKLLVDNRDEEELLTDATTIALGFGILTTNNTDRYRSSGDWNRTTWSISSAGYLPPQAMAYLLALWSAARGSAAEIHAIEKHLEPNQSACYRAALDELGNARELLASGDAPNRIKRVAPEEFTPVDPRSDEIREPARPQPQESNRGRAVYRKVRQGVLWVTFLGSMPGFLAGMFLSMIAFGDEANSKTLAISIVCAGITAALSAWHFRRPVCSACGKRAPDDVAVCAGCGGTLGRRVTEDELYVLRVQELERRAREEIPYEECELCEPEHPCEEHRDVPRVTVAPIDDDEDEDLVEALPRPRRRTFSKAIFAIAVIAVVVGVVIGLRRQTHVRVYFDNALGKPLTLQLDGAAIPLPGRALMRELAPGVHHIVIRDGDRELERFDATVTKQAFLDALREPHFYVYNVAGAGIYQRLDLVYAREAYDRQSTSTLFALDRWIEQPNADFVFAALPQRLEIQARTVPRTAFEIADGWKLYHVADEWTSKGRRDDALRALKRGIELAPCDTSTRSELLRFYEDGGRHELTIRAAMEWVERCDSSIEAHRTYQEVLRQDGATGSAIQYYRERLRAMPSGDAHYLYGRLLHGDAALAEFREAVRLAPNLKWAHVALGYELLVMEHDAEAYAAFEDALRMNGVAGSAAEDYARAAVAIGKQDDALAFIGGLNLHPQSLFRAKWILTRSKKDWDAAKVALADYERGESTPETAFLHATLDYESGAQGPITLDDRVAFQEALENGRVDDAFALETKLRTDHKPNLFSIYAIESAMLAHAPDAATRLTSLRGELTKKDGVLLALADILEGRANAMPDALLDPTEVAHGWYAMAVRAASKGDHAEAKRLFEKAAARALDRELPYRLALAQASR